MKQVRMMDEHMARVPKGHFAEPQTLAYDVFVRLGPDHFVLVGRAGTLSTIHRLKAFEAELVPWFYLLQGEYPRYVDQTVGMALAQKSSSRQQMLQAVGAALSAVLEFTRFAGMTPAAWMAVQKLADLVQETAMARPALGALMTELNRTGEAQVRHAVGVAMLALLIGRETGASADSMKHLAAAGLMHDIGWLRLPKDLITTREDMLEGEDLRLYRTHPEEGAKLLRDCSQVPSEVAMMVAQSHENVIGTGFPHQLKGEDVSRMSMVVALAERFCEMTMGDGMHQDFMSPTAAVNTIANVEGNPYPMDLLRIVERLVRTGEVKGPR